MNSRERITAVIEHKKTDRFPVDLGSTVQTGVHVTVVAKLRKALGLDDRPVRIVEPYGMLGEVDEELTDRLGIDTVAFWPPETVFGFPNENWKPWTMPDGTEVLVPEKFNTRIEPDGRIYQYPCGDQTVSPCAVMPKGGFYFDSTNRQQPIDESQLNVTDNLEDYQLLTDKQLEYYAKEADRLYHTNRALMALMYGTNFGDIGYLTAPWRKETPGIRSTEEFYMGLLTRQDYIQELFDGQCDVAIKNLESLFQAVGNKISVINVCANDLGTQSAPIIRCDMYDQLFKPFHKRINDWIHEKTSWKTFFHSCGAIKQLIPSIIEAGFDILNPIQWTAADMDRKSLKDEFGEKICLWGGGIDTQQTLPFGNPEEVYKETQECIRILGKGGGYIFNIVHCIQPNTPIENILVMFEAIKDSQSV